MAQDNRILHNQSEQRFVVVHNGHESYLKYSKDSEGALEMYSTFTHPESRGQGVAKELATAALDYAKENNFKVIPSCWYVDKFIKEHSEYEGLRA